MSEPKKINIFVKIIIYFFTTILMLVLFAFGVVFVMEKGPSKKATELFTLSCNETSAMKWVPGIFMSEKEVNAILYPDLIGTVQNGTSVITIVGDKMTITTEDEVTSGVGSENVMILPTAPAEGEEEAVTSAAANGEVVEVIDLRGGTYKGKVMLVHDPSKVLVASIDSFGGVGMTLESFLAKYDAIGCTNAGGFEDENGKGKGGIPDGVVIRDGQIVYGSAGTSYKDVLGFDENNVLHVGNMTGQQALNEGIINGTSFDLGPVLIKDGEVQTIPTSGINPRSAIGQAADGTVILITIEGRMVDSLGATCSDLIDIFTKYGAVNAANLDGGSSSGMYYKGERITRSSSVIGDRPVPTAIMVLK